ncbi:MAG: calcium/sodium antiporter [Saprospiraceae bacterium]|nr:calcium/sodium antiporter [Bacteroidia bacterium]NNE16347.1 calcium/sodium antiporter [Saprospiraceae bacterium]NNL91033.1 calcium/sodium antiporter [Saprospiraceae bacterium]
MITFILISAVALGFLLFASDVFIAAAEKIGLSLGISPFIIGVTIVAFGTSLPELATSIAAVYAGTSEIVAGNVIGSNITNILLVLGLTALVGKRINLNFNIWEIDMPLLIGSALLCFLMLRDSQFTLLEAVICLIALVGFLINSVKGEKTEKEDRPKTRLKDVGLLLLGGLIVYFAADYTIVGIKGIAELADIDPDVISLTFVALGTSLPEVVVSIAAAKRGKHAIAVGNVLGSNIFNTYAVMAIPRFLDDLTIADSITQLGLPFMLVSTIVFGCITISQKISRWEGLLLLLLYACYIGELYNSL